MSRQAFYQKQQRDHRRLQQLQEVKRLVVARRRDLPRLGTRKLHYLLAGELNRLRIKIGRDALFAFLRTEHLLVLPRKSCTRTTWSKHWLHKHPNRVKDTTLKRCEQVWVSDITYVPTKSGTAYLSLITDAYSRKIVGYHVSEDLRTESVAEALRMAIRDRQTNLPLIHHSDRGLQYCAAHYQHLLSKEGIAPSMTDGYDCYQNALAERINGILKGEFLLTTCCDAHQLALVIKQSVSLYNNQRPHQSLQYKTPTFIHEKSLAEMLNQGSKSNH